MRTELPLELFFQLSKEPKIVENILSGNKFCYNVPCITCKLLNTYKNSNYCDEMNKYRDSNKYLSKTILEDTNFLELLEQHPELLI